MIGANGDIPGYNMFAYCSNNPVVRADYYGTMWLPPALVNLTGSSSNLVDSMKPKCGGDRIDAAPVLPDEFRSKIKEKGTIKYNGHTLSIDMYMGKSIHGEYEVYSFCQLYDRGFGNIDFIVSEYYFKLSDNTAMYNNLMKKSNLYEGLYLELRKYDLGLYSSGDSFIDGALMGISVLSVGFEHMAKNLKNKALEYKNLKNEYYLEYVKAYYFVDRKAEFIKIIEF